MPVALLSSLQAPDRGLSSATSVFMTYRPRLFGIAYRMLGNVAEAEDIVQDVWLRWQTCDRRIVREPAAFLAVTTTRLAINARQSARSRHERPIGGQPPESPSAVRDPGQEAERVDALARAVGLLLAKLSPAERAAFILREGFDYPYARIAAIVHTSEAGARQLLTRGRRRLSSERRATVHPIEHRRLVDGIVAAAEAGEMSDLERLLAPPGPHAPVQIIG